MATATPEPTALEEAAQAAREAGFTGALRALGQAYWQRIRTGELGAMPVIVAIAVIWGYFQSQQSVFLSARNLANLVLQIGVTGTIAVGIVLVLLLGEIDLSVGSIMILCSALVAWAIVNHNWAWYWGILITLAAGAAIGAFQGAWFAVVGVPSFVVTLAGLLGWQGVQQHVLGATGTINVFDSHISAIATSYLPHVWGWILAIAAAGLYALSRLWEAARRRRARLPAAPVFTVVVGAALVAAVALLATAILNGQFKNHWIFGDYTAGIPTAGVILLGLVIFFAWLTTRTRFGRYIFAVGGNAEAARRAGINVRLIRIAVFALSGFLAAIAGLIQTARLAPPGPALKPP